MKIGTLRAIAHDVADSLGSGTGMLVGVYFIDVFGEAKRSPGSVICIDFLGAKATRRRVSPPLARTIAKYCKALPKLCAKHGACIDDFKVLTASYSADTFNRRMVVKICDRVGRCCVDE